MRRAIALSHPLPAATPGTLRTLLVPWVALAILGAQAVDFLHRLEHGTTLDALHSAAAPGRAESASHDAALLQRQRAQVAAARPLRVALG